VVSTHPPVGMMNGSHRCCLIGTESVQLAFIGDLPAAGPLVAGGEVVVGWKIDKSAGMYQEGCDPVGDYKYSPLYTMKQMRRPRERIFR
jgi:hypothetical protein